MSEFRSHQCAEVNQSLIGEVVRVVGWVQRRRDHGGVIFIDLRDRSGLLQVVVDPDSAAAFAHAEGVRNEYVIAVRAKVRARPEGTVNTELPTGQVEVFADQLNVLNACEPIPFQLDDDDVGEAVRLKYRYLDLRRQALQDALRLRHRCTTFLRNFLHQHDFIDIETPILTRSTPEGARDYLVPSRVHAGEFFALPQSPQLFKQLLMVSGFERYYQIARCFRDEDLRADRQPEFTQLDIELSFCSEEEIMQLMEQMIAQMFAEVAGIELELPFQRLTYKDAMERYGSDRPDSRIPLELVSVTDLVKEVEFKVFQAAANLPDGRVAAMKLSGGVSLLSRKQLDQYVDFVSQYGARGLAYIKVNNLAEGIEGLQSPLLRHLPADVIEKILQRVQADSGDIVFFGADRAAIVNDSMAALREKMGSDLNLIQTEWAPLWVVDFPLFERDVHSGRLNSLHHPFTAPKEEQTEELVKEPESVLSRAYDMVLNGSEIGGGSIRIHQREVQEKIFTALGIDEKEANEKFDFLLQALSHGAPPHGGIAFGLDRVVAMLAGASSIRDVIAFPKTQRASCLLTGSPSAVEADQLAELHIKVRAPS